MADTFTAQERRELAGRARTLHERLDGPANVRETEPPMDPERVVEEWRERFPDESVFRERLDYEGLTPEEIRETAAATRWPPDEPLPDWVSRIEELVGYVERAPSDGSAGVDLPEEVPFRELFEVVAGYARGRLPDDVPTDATSPLVEGLVNRLTRLCVRPLYVEFKSFVKHHDEELAHADPDEFTDPPDEHYRSFVEAMFDRGFANLCLEYPVLARQLARSIAFWVESTAEAVRRIESDRPALRDAFGVEGEVTELAPLADDSHARGRVPIRVSFGDDDVVYKPRDVGGGVAFYTVLDRLEPRLPTPNVRKPQYVSREEYGWMEPVEYRDLPDADAARRYYRRAGVLLCLAYALNLTDCQLENVIACGEHPTIVDAETVFHPHVGADGRDGSNDVATFVERSPLLTGLLPFLTGEMDEDAFGPPTAAGFGADSGEVELSDRTVPAIKAVNTDVMAVVEEPPTVGGDTNTPTANGEDCPPADHVEAIVDGFEAAHETVRALHDDGEFFASVADADLVEGVRNRLVYRDTALYASILRSTTTRAALRDGVRLSVEFEELAVPFFDGRIDSDRWWPLYAAERKALRRRDVPRFTASTDGQTVRHDGEALDVEVDSSGLERCRTRLDRLGDADQARQASLVRQTFDPDESGEPDALRAPPDPVAVTDQRLRREAVELFEVALDAAIETPDGRGWVSPIASVPLRLMPAEAPLYYGKCGIALTGAALYEVTGRDRYRRAVDDVLGDVVASATVDATDLDFGGLRGVGSVVYSLSVVADLLDDETYRSAALEATRGVTPDRLAEDDAFDVVDGTAGVLLGLLAYDERFGDADVRDRAVDCGERLLDARTSADGYCVWDTRDAYDPVVGFAHGQSGIAYSLTRLAEVTGTRRYRTAAREALAYEADRAETADAPGGHVTVPDRVPDWCRGRPGRALARLGIGDRLGDGAVLAEAREDLGIVEAADPALIDNLCCGNLGRAEVLLEGERRLDGAVSGATELVGRCLARREQDGVLELPGHSGAYPNVSFFHGVSGAAYTLLRHRSPDALPCVLLFE